MLALVALFVAVAPTQAMAQKYFMREKIAPASGQTAAQTPAVVAVSCGPVLSRTGPASGTKTAIGDFSTIALAMAACEGRAKTGYVPNLCQAVLYSSTGLYRTNVMMDGVMNPTGTSPDYSAGGVTYSYFAANCTSK